MELKREATEETLQKIVDSLHGSGLDCEATITEHKDKFKIRWAYHCLNNVGYYDGWAEFTIWVPLASPKDFRLTFKRCSQYRAKKYQLRDYLEDLFAGEIRAAFYQ